MIHTPTIQFSPSLPIHPGRELNLFASHFSQTANLLQISALALGVMLLSWLAMTFGAQILRILGPTTLRVLGSVFGALQLSFGIEMILYTV